MFAYPAADNFDVTYITSHWFDKYKHSFTQNGCLLGECHVFVTCCASVLRVAVPRGGGGGEEGKGEGHGGGRDIGSNNENPLENATEQIHRNIYNPLKNVTGTKHRKTPLKSIGTWGRDTGEEAAGGRESPLKSEPPTPTRAPDNQFRQIERLRQLY